MIRRRAALSWGLLLASTVAGCNLVFGITGGSPGTSSSSSTGGSGTGGMATGGTTAGDVAVMPPSTTLLGMTTLAFTATVGGSAAAVTWTIDEAPAGGSVTAAGVYTAPAADGTFHLRATHAGKSAAATITIQQTAVPSVLVPTGALANATGHGSQTHVVYGATAKEWWLFSVGTGAADHQVITRHSATFAPGSWQPGETLALALATTGDGRDLSVAYRQLGGHDVVHLSQGYTNGSALGRYHARAALTPGHVTFGAAVDVNSGTGLSIPDGAATVILPDGTVIDSTGYLDTPGVLPQNCGTHDPVVYTSNAKDDGATDPDPALFAQHVLWCVPSTIHARQLLAVGGAAVHLYADGSNNQPVNLSMNVRSATTGQWSPDQTAPSAVFLHDAPAQYDLDDWTAAVQNGKTVHAVRRLVTGAFEHRIMSALGTWADPTGNPIATTSTLPASGLVLLPYGDGLVLLALSNDSGHRVLYTAYDGTGWAPQWGTLYDDSSTDRSFLAGFAPESGAKPAVIWTQTAASSYAIAGALLP